MENALKKLLVIDRDGTVIIEPAVDQQVDSMDKFRFLPGAITSLARIAGMGEYQLILATNQDGLGTPGFPEADFWPVQHKMTEILAGEGVAFDDVLIDRTFAYQNAPTRKPAIGMFAPYLKADYDLARSYVIGDRITDIQLAANLGARGILIQSPEKGIEMVAWAGLENVCALITDSWPEIAEFLRRENRSVNITRKTHETDITLTLDLDGRGGSHIATGLGFLDHMLAQLVHHGGIALGVECRGDLHVDQHHTIEDVALVLGQAVYRALGSKRGVERYGFVLPMDESACLVLLDFGGRSEFLWNVKFEDTRIGDVPTQMLKHFFKSFCQAARCNLHITASGENDHHKAEAIFKAFARSLRMAVRRDPFSEELPSSKGVL